MHIKILPSLYIYIYIFVCIVEALTGTINDWVIKFTVTKFKKKKNFTSKLILRKIPSTY